MSFPRVLAAALAGLVLAPVPADSCGPGGGKVLAGYFTSWGIYDRDFQVEDVDADSLTHLLYAFSNVEAGTGTCTLGDPWADVDRPGAGDCSDPGCLRGNFARLLELKAAHPHLRVLISIGGWTWSGAFSDLAATRAGRETFASSCIDLYLRGELGAPWGTHPGIFDGLDIDWEFPVSGGLQPGRPEDRENHALLMEELRRQLDALETETGRSYELSIAAGGSPAHRVNYDLPRLAAVLDHLMVMAYDFHGSWDAVTNFHSAPHPSAGDPGPSGLTTAEAIDGYLAGGVPADRLLMGLPFYGRSWAGVAPGPDGNGLYQPAASVGPGTYEAGNLEYRDIAANHAPVMDRLVHPEALSPWLHDGDVFISFDDPQSVAVKAELALVRELGGAMVWELSNDLRGVPAPPDSLLAALTGGLCVPDPAPPGLVGGLRLTRAGSDLGLSWDEASGADGGYRIYSVGSAADSRGQRSGGTGTLRGGSPGPGPVELPGEAAGGAAFYQVVAVGSDGTEGPN